MSATGDGLRALGRSALAALGLAGEEDGAPLPLGRPLSPFERSLPSLLGGPSGLERTAESFGAETRVMRIGGRTRRYHVLAPPGDTRGRPLVLALHGGGGNGLRFLQRIDARAMVRSHGLVVVAPQGYSCWWSRKGSWNADSITPLGRAERIGIDDLRFLRAVIGSVEAELGTDPGRVYAMGLSKGGMMAYRLACAMPDRMAAIACVAGTLSTARCPKGAPVPLLHIHGSRDENVPLDGGRGRFSSRGADWPEVSRGINLFRRANGCTGEPEVVRASPDTTCYIYRGASGAEVRFCLVEGGGHGWPGAAPTARQRRREVFISSQFRATDYIARFFRAH